MTDHEKGVNDTFTSLLAKVTNSNAAPTMHDWAITDADANNIVQMLTEANTPLRWQWLGVLLLWLRKTHANAKETRQVYAGDPAMKVLYDDMVRQLRLRHNGTLSLLQAEMPRSKARRLAGFCPVFTK